MTITTIALNNLVLSPLNMRQGDVDVSDLVASMKGRIGQGQPPLLQNLRVTLQKNAEGVETGKAEVHVGGRRLRALKELAKAKVLSKTVGIEVSVCSTEADALEETIEENMVRVDPHPAAQYVAYASLFDAGKTVDEIAARFGQTVQTVRRRLALGKVSPKLMELYHQDKISAAQMKIFCLSDDQAIQEAAWFEAEHGWQREPEHLRKRITQEEVKSTNNQLVALVGIDAYVAAGGAVRQDLFSDDGVVYFQDPALLETLALDILNTKQDEVKAEGWKWVEVHTVLSHDIKEPWSRFQPNPNALTDENAANVAAWEAEIDAQYEAEHTDWDVIRERRSAISELQNEAGFSFDPADVAFGGAVITISRGEVAVERGFITKVDDKARRAVVTIAEGGEGAASKPSEPEASGLSGVLREALSGEHSLAMRAAIASQPLIALVAVVHRLLLLSHYNGDNGHLYSCITLQGAGYSDPMKAHEKGLAETVAGVELAQVREKMQAALPSEMADLWPFLMEQSQDRLLAFLAYASSGMINALQHGHSRGEAVRSGQQLASALSLDMSEYWTATADNYFSRVSKPLVLEAVTEVAGAPAAAGMAAMKKGELAKRAEEALDGSRWLPAIFRHPEPTEVSPEESSDDVELKEAA